MDQEKSFKIRPDILVKETTLFQTMAHIECSETSHGGFLQTNIKILKKYVWKILFFDKVADFTITLLKMNAVKGVYQRLETHAQKNTILKQLFL